MAIGADATQGSGKGKSLDRRGRRVQIDYPVRIFEALVLLECAGCGASIDTGMLFTRKTFRDEANDMARTLPVCGGCQPFTPVAWTEAVAG